MFDHWFPDQASTYAAELDGVFYLIFWVVGVWFVLAEGALIFFAIRYWRRPGRPASSVAGRTLKHASWILVPAVLVLGLDLGIDVVGTRAFDRVKLEIPDGEVQIRVSAKQFEWSGIYPGPDRALGTSDDLIVPTEIHVPVGQVINMTLVSEDVIHSFFVPELRLKQDIVPGRAIPAWFEATKVGRYELGCAELCGLAHYRMRGVLVVEPVRDYLAWLSEKQAELGAGT